MFSKNSNALKTITLSRSHEIKKNLLRVGVDLRTTR